MADKKEDLKVLQRLTWILKSGLYSLLEGIYLFWIGAAFACSGWLAGLLSILCIVAIHPLRWLWDESADVKILVDTDPRIAQFQKRLKYFFASTVLVCDAALVVLVFFTFLNVIGHQYWVYGAVASVVAGEVLHFRIRSINKNLKELSDEIYNK